MLKLNIFLAAAALSANPLTNLECLVVLLYLEWNITLEVLLREKIITTTVTPDQFVDGEGSCLYNSTLFFTSYCHNSTMSIMVIFCCLFLLVLSWILLLHCYEADSVEHKVYSCVICVVLRSCFMLFSIFYTVWNFVITHHLAFLTC